jgi:multimeric flavodoxin WrbA
MRDMSDLKALFINTTLTRSPGLSHTERLMRKSMAIMDGQGVSVEYLRAVDHEIAFGIYPDMREHGWERDAWPEVFWPRIAEADILVIGTPIWLGEESAVCRLIIERLYAYSSQTNDDGQYVFYGKTGGCVVTGNEDGIKHCAMTVLYSLQHIGYAIPPQADCGWIGEAGPGASYGDDGAGLDNDFTKRNTTFMSWNLMHMARLLKDAGGFPAHGNQSAKWEEGERFGHPDG